MHGSLCNPGSIFLLLLHMKAKRSDIEILELFVYTGQYRVCLWTADTGQSKI